MLLKQTKQKQPEDVSKPEISYQIIRVTWTGFFEISEPLFKNFSFAFKDFEKVLEKNIENSKNFIYSHLTWSSLIPALIKNTRSSDIWFF